MPTMIQKFECGVCYVPYGSREAAQGCVDAHLLGPDDPDAVVTTLDLWECDGEGCRNTFDDQWSAQQCEAGHETADADGRQGPDPRRMDGNTVMEWASAVLGRKS